MNFGVNHRAIVGSTSGSMPLAATVEMRSSQTCFISAGMRLDVSQRLSDFNISGEVRASVCPIMPPIDRPIQCVCATPSAFSSARASSASCVSV